REERCCKYCGQSFVVKKKSTKKFCSDDCRKKWALIPENKEKRINASLESVKEKYNVNSTLQLEKIQEKSKKTKKDRYGDENFVNVAKAKKTKKDKYGYENYNNKEKTKKTKEDRYGDENYNNREKAEDTMMKEFGVSHAMKLKKYQEKAKQTNKQNFGVEYPLQNEKIKTKKNNTVKVKYGVDFISQLEEIKEKVREKYYEKFDSTKIYFLLKNSGVDLLDKYVGLRKDKQYINYDFKCLKCNTTFSGTFSNHRPPVCRTCYPMYKNNNIHIEIREFLKSNEVKLKDNYRQLISPQEVDFFLYEYNIAIEIDGNYWHSEIGGEKDRTYHINKTFNCLQKKVKLIHIFEDEWIFKKDIVKSRILNIINKTNNVIYARKCQIVEVSEKEKVNFLEFNHLMGNSKDSIKIGLKFNGEIVSLMTFSKRRIALGKNKTEYGDWELNRFCSKIDFNVVGAFQKLLNFFAITYKPKKITTYADVRWSGLEHEKTVYFKSGFSFIHQSPPSFWYFVGGDYLRRYHRFTFNKRKLESLCKNDEKIKNMTAWDMAQGIKMDRIWDCGTLKFQLFFN
ncbi:MAG: hypothetical protein WC466_08580, partial [Candidatus Izemoplasmatales bacterium]